MDQTYIAMTIAFFSALLIFDKKCSLLLMTSMYIYKDFPKQLSTLDIIFVLERHMGQVIMNSKQLEGWNLKIQVSSHQVIFFAEKMELTIGSSNCEPVFAKSLV